MTVPLNLAPPLKFVQQGTVLGTATTGPTGQYTVTLASGKATAKQTVNVVAKMILDLRVNHSYDTR